MIASPVVSPLEDVDARIESFDWGRVREDLDIAGNAVLPGLLSPEECDGLAGLYYVEEPFRSRIVMAKHGFGRGEYQYFRYPLPEPVASLRTALYPHLGAGGGSLERRAGPRRALSGDTRGVPRPLPCRRSDPPDPAAPPLRGR